MYERLAQDRYPEMQWMAVEPVDHNTTKLRELLTSPLSIRFNGHFPDEPGSAGVY